MVISWWVIHFPWQHQNELVNKCQLHHFTLSNLIKTKLGSEQEFKANYITLYLTACKQNDRPVHSFDIDWKPVSHPAKPVSTPWNTYGQDLPAHPLPARDAWIKRPMSCDKLTRRSIIWVNGLRLEVWIVCVWFVNKTVTLGMCIHVCVHYICKLYHSCFFQTWYLAPVWMWNKGILYVVMSNTTLAVPRTAVSFVCCDSRCKVGRNTAATIQYTATLLFDNFTVV